MLQSGLGASELQPEMNYVLGFAFSHDFKEVLLVQKNRPAWQNGKLNGIGGKIELGETPLQAMEREFMEETRFVQLKENLIDEDPRVWKPDWTYCGIRQRARFRETDIDTYRMYVYACKFPIEYCLFDDKLFDSTVFVEWYTPQNPDPEPEQIVKLKYERHLLESLGVPGLRLIADLAAETLRNEGKFTFAILDKPRTQ